MCGPLPFWRGVFYWEKLVADVDYLCDELSRYDIEIDDKMERRIKRLLSLGYSCADIARGINPKFVWDDTHGRLDTNE
jgi:hypothetical protein